MFRVRRGYAKTRAKLMRERRRMGAGQGAGAANIANELLHEANTYHDNAAECHTDYLLRRATLLMVPIPDRSQSDAWELSRSGRTLLTTTGIAQLRASVREEEKATREAWTFWATIGLGIIGGITGVLGLLVAYAALHAPK